MMKSVFVPHNIGSNYIKELNLELKDCNEIVKEIAVNDGTILIIDITTRKDKLIELDKKSKE